MARLDGLSCQSGFSSLKSLLGGLWTVWVNSGFFCSPLDGSGSVSIAF